MDRTLVGVQLVNGHGWANGFISFFGLVYGPYTRHDQLRSCHPIYCIAFHHRDLDQLELSSTFTQSFQMCLMFNPGFGLWGGGCNDLIFSGVSAVFFSKRCSFHVTFPGLIHMLQIICIRHCCYLNQSSIQGNYQSYLSSKFPMQNQLVATRSLHDASNLAMALDLEARLLDWLQLHTDQHFTSFYCISSGMRWYPAGS